MKVTLRELRKFIRVSAVGTVQQLNESIDPARVEQLKSLGMEMKSTPRQEKNGTKRHLNLGKTKMQLS